MGLMDESNIVRRKLSPALVRARRNYQLYLLLLAPMVWLVIFQYVPMYGVIVAFKSFRADLGILWSPWVGLRHFERFFRSFYFERTVINTIVLSAYGLVAAFPMPIILALAMNSSLRRKFTRTVQFITYMPYFISTVVLVGMILEFLNPRVGLLNMARQTLGLQSMDFMARPELFRHIYVWSGIWQNAGWGTIIYLAALAGIDPELHEAATCDGANRLRRIIHIDLPGILPTITILLILNLGTIISIGFEKAFLMQNPLNLATSEVISTFVYKVGLAASVPNFSYGAAIGLFLSVINFGMIALVNAVAKRIGETSLW